MERAQCPHCPKNYAGKGGLKQHTDKHHPTGEWYDKSYACKFCQRSHACRENMERHLLSCKKNPKAINAGSEECKFECDVCKQRFKAKGNMETHRLKKHGVEKPESKRDRSNQVAALKSSRFEVKESGAKWHIKDTETNQCFGEPKAKSVNQQRCDMMNEILGLFQHYDGSFEETNARIVILGVDRPKQVAALESARSLLFNRLLWARMRG